MVLTNEIKEKNFSIFKEKMNEILGVNDEKIEQVFGDKLFNATFAIEPRTNTAYEGSLLNVVLRQLTPRALKLNEILNPSIVQDKNKIIKICFLQHLAKAFMYEPNDNEWEKEKRGKMFKYADSKLALRLGSRSLAIALRLGVELDEYDIEALTIIDKDGNDEQAKFFTSPLAMIIKQANEQINMEGLFVV